MSNSEQEIQQFFEEYAGAFNDFNAAKIAAYFNFPSMVIDKDGAVSFSQLWEARKNFEQRVAHHREIGYSHAKIKSLTIDSISSNILCLVQVSWIFIGYNGSIIHEFDSSYTLCKYQNQWRITVVLFH